jgi:hypothetical protein
MCRRSKYLEQPISCSRLPQRVPDPRAALPPTSILREMTANAAQVAQIEVGGRACGRRWPSIPPARRNEVRLMPGLSIADAVVGRAIAPDGAAQARAALVPNPVRSSRRSIVIGHAPLRWGYSPRSNAARLWSSESVISVGLKAGIAFGCKGLTKGRYTDDRAGQGRQDHERRSVVRFRDFPSRPRGGRNRCVGR